MYHVKLFVKKLNKYKMFHVKHFMNNRKTMFHVKQFVDKYYKKCYTISMLKRKVINKWEEL